MHARTHSQAHQRARVTRPSGASQRTTLSQVEGPIQPKPRPAAVSAALARWRGAGDGAAAAAAAAAAVYPPLPPPHQRSAPARDPPPAPLPPSSGVTGTPSGHQRGFTSGFAPMDGDEFVADHHGFDARRPARAHADSAGADSAELACCSERGGATSSAAPLDDEGWTAGQAHLCDWGDRADGRADGRAADETADETVGVDGAADGADAAASFAWGGDAGSAGSPDGTTSPRRQFSAGPAAGALAPHRSSPTGQGLAEPGSVAPVSSVAVRRRAAATSDVLGWDEGTAGGQRVDRRAPAMESRLDTDAGLIAAARHAYGRRTSPDAAATATPPRRSAGQLTAAVSAPHAVPSNRPGRLAGPGWGDGDGDGGRGRAAGWGSALLSDVDSSTGRSDADSRVVDGMVALRSRGRTGRARDATTSTAGMTRDGTTGRACQLVPGPPASPRPVSESGSDTGDAPVTGYGRARLHGEEEEVRRQQQQGRGRGEAWADAGAPRPHARSGSLPPAGDRVVIGSRSGRSRARAGHGARIAAGGRGSACNSVSAASTPARSWRDSLAPHVARALQRSPGGRAELRRSREATEAATAELLRTRLSHPGEAGRQRRGRAQTGL